MEGTHDTITYLSNVQQSINLLENTGVKHDKVELLSNTLMLMTIKDIGEIVNMLLNWDKRNTNQIKHGRR